jgi:hypothetical protein
MAEEKKDPDRNAMRRLISERTGKGRGGGAPGPHRYRYGGNGGESPAPAPSLLQRVLGVAGAVGEAGMKRMSTPAPAEKGKSATPTPTPSPSSTPGNTGNWREKGYVRNGNGKGKGERIDELLREINGG